MVAFVHAPSNFGERTANRGTISCEGEIINHPVVRRELTNQLLLCWGDRRRSQLESPRWAARSLQI